MLVTYVSGSSDILMILKRGLVYALQEVQGHIAKTDIDPGASTAWLPIENDLLCSTPGSGVALKRVFNPFDWNLRIYNSATIANAPPSGRSLSHYQPCASPAMLEQAYKSHFCVIVQLRCRRLSTQSCVLFVFEIGFLHCIPVRGGPRIQASSQ